MGLAMGKKQILTLHRGSSYFLQYACTEANPFNTHAQKLIPSIRMRTAQMLIPSICMPSS